VSLLLSVVIYGCIAANRSLIAFAQVLASRSSCCLYVYDRKAQIPDYTAPCAPHKVLGLMGFRIVFSITVLNNILISNNL